jgi:DNA-binding MarR family transcriptional regulator
MDTKWLSPSEMRAWRAYIGTFSDLSAALEADLVHEGVDLGDYQVLVFLSEAPNRSLRMCDLAERLALSPSGLTRRLDGLVKTGAVERQPSHDDRRVMMAVLTDAGFATLERVAPHHVASVRRRIFDRLDTDQVAALESIFTAIGTGLRSDPNCPKASVLAGVAPAGN